MARVVVERSSGCVRVVIGPGRTPETWAFALFTAAFATIFALGGWRFWRMALDGGFSGIEPIAFGAIWTTGVVAIFSLAFKVLAWRLFGVEEICLIENSLVVNETLWVSVRRRSFRGDAVRWTRVDERPVVSKGYTFVRRTVAFDYNGTIVRLRSQLSDEEARTVVYALAVEE